MSELKFPLFLLTISLFFLTGCERNPLDIDSSKVTIDLPYYNLDSAFVKSDKSDLLMLNKQLSEEMQDAYFYVLGRCLRINAPDDSIVVDAINNFRTDPYIADLEKRIEARFYPVGKRHQKIVSAFKNLKFHFPGMRLPKKVVYANCLFESSAFSTENEIVMGLERYLGEKEPLIQKLPPDVFFNWIKQGMDERYMERDAVCSWLVANHVPEVDGNLAESIVYWGKVIYLTQSAFPKEKASLSLRYSEDDFKWAEENELAFWNYLKNEKLLFKINERDKANFLSPAPFTIGLPEKGPDRLGQFLGWKMVRNYMQKNDVSLPTLLATPYNQILQSYEIE